MSDASAEQRSVAAGKPAVPTSIPMGPSTSLDLSFLPEAERTALALDYARGAVDIAKKAQELHVDVAVLKTTLHSLADTTKQVAEAGNSVTITHSTTTKVGRTEVIMGNTENAKTGKLSRSQTGEMDMRLWYFVGAIIAVIVLAAVLTHR